MSKVVVVFLLNIASAILGAQVKKIEGNVRDAVSLQPILNVKVEIATTTLSSITDVQGEFSFKAQIPLGAQILIVSKSGYITKRFPITINREDELTFNDITLERDYASSQDLYTITLSDDELNNDIDGTNNVTGLLSASLDVFQRTAAFEFSQSFFRPKGLDSENATLLINGIAMNKLHNGRPLWSNWGGLNDATRNQELATGLQPSSYTFGGILGATNINTNASQYKKGGRITYSSSNRSYTNRVLATYASGLSKSNWAYVLSLGRRWGNQGYQDATLYDANSLFLSVEKRINSKHNLNFTGIYAPNRRGRSSANTQEVFDIKGIKYNAYWGVQNGKQRNSRIRNVEEPILMLNHYWDFTPKTRLNTTIGYQFGQRGNSRLDNNGTDLVNGIPEGGGANPSPTYYQKLPSYFERNFPNDLQFAFLALRDFENGGQIDWNALYEANISNSQRGGNAVYALYEDKVDDKQLTGNMLLHTELNPHTILDFGATVRRLKSENYANVLDLFGANTYLDVDQFASTPREAQNDLQTPNRLVGEGDAFKYNYNLFANVINGFAQTQFSYNKLDVFTAMHLTKTQYQREGLYQNGAFPETSLGKGEALKFTGYGAKAGIGYKISGKHLLNINGSYTTRAPTLRNTYSNARENHNIVPLITEEKLMHADVNYNFRSAFVKAKLTGYYTTIQDANEISFFFADGIGGDNVAFVQEILQGVDKQHIGLEFGIEAQVTPEIKLKAVTALGQFIYTNNPNLFLTTEADDEAEAAGFVGGFRDFGVSHLKNYKVASGPQRASAIGFEYRDPDFWWFGATANFFSNAYVDISPLTRSANFSTDFDGNTFNDFDAVLAEELLQQEQFEAYMLVNLVGGKSWRIGKHYVSVFASVNNLLNTVFRTGGFEQGRNANFRQLRDDSALNTPVFGTKYWYGRGASYFLNMNYTF